MLLSMINKGVEKSSAKVRKSFQLSVVGNQFFCLISTKKGSIKYRTLLEVLQYVSVFYSHVVRRHLVAGIYF